MKKFIILPVLAVMLVAGVVYAAQAPTLSVTFDAPLSTDALSWTDNSNNEDGYSVERQKNFQGQPLDWTEVATTGPNTTSLSYFIGTSSSWSYRVRTFRNVGGGGTQYGQYSNVVLNPNN